MLICYANLLQIDPDQHGEKCRFMLSNSGMPLGIMVSLDTNEFRVEYKEGKAEVNLFRHLTVDQARQLAAELIKAADNNEVLAKRYTIVAQGSPHTNEA